MSTHDRMMASYEAGQVTRYHTHPRLAKLGQNDAEHQWGVAVIILQLFPDASLNLIREAITHDTGERFSGDLPHPVKRDNPKVAVLLSGVEARVRTDRLHNVGPFPLTDEEFQRLKLADGLECVLYASIHDPRILFTRAWEQLRSDLIMSASNLGVGSDVEALISSALQRQGAEE